LSITFVHKPCLVPLDSTIRPKLFLEHPFAANRLASIWTINYLLSSIRHDRIHLTPYCFLPQVSIRRGICLFNGRWCAIHKVHNIVIPKRFCNSLSLALSGDYNVILLRILRKRLLNLFYQNKILMLMGNYRFMNSHARCNFHGKFILKKYSVSWLHCCTNMHVRYLRIYN
jgi:hypothetical protein